MYTLEGLIPGTNGKVYVTVKCHICDSFGYYKSHSPKENGQLYVEARKNLWWHLILDFSEDQMGKTYIMIVTHKMRRMPMTLTTMF